MCVVRASLVSEKNVSWGLGIEKSSRFSWENVTILVHFR